MRWLFVVYCLVLLVVDYGALFVARCVLVVVWCLLFNVRCLLFVVCCLLFVVCCLPFVGCWCLVVGSRLLVVGCCLLVVVRCFSFIACWLLHVVCCLVFGVLCLVLLMSGVFVWLVACCSVLSFVVARSCMLFVVCYWLLVVARSLLFWCSLMVARCSLLAVGC